MPDKSYDPEAFRRFEHDGWSALAAGYDRHWEHLTTQAVPVLLDAAGVGRGSRVLDVASGPGYAAAAFAAIASTGHGLTWRLPAPDVLMQSFREATARLSGLLAAQDPAALPKIAAAMTARCRPYDRGHETALPMPMVLTAATKI